MNATSQSRALRSHVAGQPRRLLPLHRADRGITLRQVQAKAWKEVQLPRPHEPKGNIKVKVLEAKGPSKGVALFLHGFGQDPTNYDTVLKGIADSGINVIAPVATRNLGTIINKEKLQTATYKDAKEVIDTMYGNANTGTEQGKTIAQLAANRDTLALAGHSVGGGLALSVVSDFPQQLTHLALMSPFYQLEPAYDPTAAINVKNPDAKPFVAPKNAAVFTGSLDFIALKGQVEKRITDPLRTKVPVASVETDNFGNGTHFGYCNSVSFNGLIIIPNLYNNVAAEALSIRKASEQIAKGKSLLNEKEAGLPRGLWALILKLLEAVGFALAGFLALEAFGVYGTRVEVETKDDLVKLLNKP